MNRGVRVVCRPSLRDGFGLAGLAALSAADGGQAATLLARLADDPEVGVVLVEEALFDALPEATREALERRALPVVIPFPGPRREEAPAPEARLVELLRRAIGYRVRLR